MIYLWDSTWNLHMMLFLFKGVEPSAKKMCMPFFGGGAILKSKLAIILT